MNRNMNQLVTFATHGMLENVSVRQLVIAVAVFCTISIVLGVVTTVILVKVFK